ncbi:PRD domain-containing protein [Companilactobacillus allii]|uniref:Transcription antiterminator lact n=1 Tax=Companilactobacillus allii TaxID=1847728 RepID=A0A1P8Q567_9LACO|nr:PRD domain-containing protein [Companilactobacillus allii]APX72975.1 transcription antiterminator lact [Companilactobacillus allii]USQ67768.1 PRD domain-containing protein [Companilactobacillus allii]
MVNILQVFNNNSVLADIGDHRQAIIKGNGIAFNKHKGSKVNTDKIEKIFYLNTKGSQENLYFLLKDIPIDIVTTTYEIIDYGNKKFDYSVLDYAYITLSDHILESTKRFNKGTYKENLIPDMEAQYPTEYAIARYALEVIQNNLGIKFPISEIRALALHFINSKGEEPEEGQLKQDESQDINDIVKKILSDNKIFRLGSNGNYFDRFMIHLQYLAGRLDKPDDGDDVLSPKFEKEMQESYPESFEIAKQIYDELQERLGNKLGSNELLYFVIHIQRLIQEDTKD